MRVHINKRDVFTEHEKPWTVCVCISEITDLSFIFISLGRAFLTQFFGHFQV